MNNALTRFLFVLVFACFTHTATTSTAHARLAPSARRPTSPGNAKRVQAKKTKKRARTAVKGADAVKSLPQEAGALAYDFGFAMGLLSVSSHHGWFNREAYVTGAQLTRNALGDHISFGGFEAVRLDIRGGKKHPDGVTTEKARDDYQRHIAGYGPNVALAYVLGVQIGIAEAYATIAPDQTHGSYRIRMATRTVLQTLTETELSDLDLDTDLMLNANAQCGNGGLGEQVSVEQASNVHAAVQRARVVYRKALAKVTAKFWNED